jgi:hypothetical protein
MCSVLVEQGLLQRFARTSMQMVADLTRCFSRLMIMIVISDGAKRLLTPSESMDEIAIEDRQGYIHSFWIREILQTVIDFTRFYASLPSICLK